MQGYDHRRLGRIRDHELPKVDLDLVVGPGVLASSLATSSISFDR